MKKPTRKSLVKQLDVAFSRWVRLRHADEHGNTTCWTCGKQDHYKNMHAGHFQSRMKYSTRWDEQNVQTQCPACNLWNQGEQYRFGIELDAHYGTGTANEITIRSNRTRKFTDAELKELIEKYRVPA